MDAQTTSTDIPHFWVTNNYWIDMSTTKTSILNERWEYVPRLSGVYCIDRFGAILDNDDVEEGASRVPIDMANTLMLHIIRIHNLFVDNVKLCEEIEKFGWQR